MDKNKIDEFLETKPEVIDVIGYGSGVKKQVGYTDDTKRQIDLIVTVDDSNKYHKENYNKHSEEYSRLGCHLLPLVSKMGTDVNYISNINYNNETYKMGIIDRKDLLEDLNNWKNFFIAGRCQKPIEIIRGDKELQEAIIRNRDNALRVALLLNYDKDISKRELFEAICSLSYNGDIRMLLKCENPNKVKNIVDGSFQDYVKMYTNNDLFYTRLGKVIPNIDKILFEFDKMPKNLVNPISNFASFTKNDLENLRKCIYNYIKMCNIISSTAQPVKSAVLNGTSKSVKYLNEKIKKGHM